MRKFDGFTYDRMSPIWLKNMIRDNENRWQEFSDEELMRWLYKELGGKFSFSRKYRYAITQEEKYRIELAAKDVVMRARRINNPDDVICIDIEETMQMLLTDLFGIDSRVVLDGSGPHVYLEVRTENYGRIKLDLQEDLYNIKSGRKTEHFAQESCYDGRYFGTIPEEQIKEIDKKLGYIGQDEKYMEDYFEDYRERIEQSETTDEKIRKVFILLECKFAEQLKSMKYCERTELYKKAIQDLIPDANIEHRTFRKDGKLISCFIVPGDSDDAEIRYYVYNGENGQYEEINEDRYQEFYQENEDIIQQATVKEPKIDE